MRWLFTSWGSRGDLHPFLALGRGLIARGHAVTLIGHLEWQQETEAAGLRFVATDEPPREALLRTHPEILSTRWGGIPSLRALVRKAIAPSFRPTLAALRREAGSHDAMLAHHFVFPAPLIAEMTGLPWATATLAPGVVPSAHSLPGAHFGRARQGILARRWNHFIWSAGQVITSQLVDPTVNELRREHRLPPVRNTVFAGQSPRLNLQLYSRHFAPLAPDWSTEKKQAAFCFYDPPGEAPLPESMEQFLAHGEPPILFTLGSAAVQNPGSFYREAVEVCRREKWRGLLLVGDDQNRPADLPPSVCALNYASYGRLMPRVRAVVHQGGIGTLSHVLRAGVSAVVCPFAFDQPNNARRVEALGVAEVVLPRERNAKGLHRALHALFDGHAAARADDLGKLIRAEDGVADACAILEKTFVGS